MVDAFSMFRERDVDAAIERVAAARPLTLIVGAGSSMEAGLPSWSGLISSLLVRVARRVAERDRLDGTEIELLRDWLMEQDDLLAAGAMCKHVLADAFHDALHDALYGDEPEVLPAETARAVAALRADRASEAIELITTNYDVLLEAALRLELRRRRLKRSVARLTSDQPLDGRIGVRHLHGVMTPRGTVQGKVVLSEADYHLMQQADQWQEALIRRRLQHSSCLFVGTSLTDPNLLRYLYRSGRGAAKHVAIFARQAEMDRYDRVGPKVASARESIAGERWRQMRIDPLMVNYFCEVAQFVWEAVHLRQTRAANTPYTNLNGRLERWDDAMTRSVLRTSAAAFRDAQHAFAGFLEELLEAAAGVLAEAGCNLRRGERLGIGLWVFRPRTNGLALWATADRVKLDPAAIAPLPVTHGSPFVSVQAFCHGALVSRSTTHHVITPWNHVVASPVYLTSPSVGRLPVGAVTLASTLPEEQSVLGNCQAAIRNNVMPMLATRAVDLLTPPNWDTEVGNTVAGS